MPRSLKLTLAVIFLVALLLRVAGLRSGLPSETRRLATFHPDESITMYSLEGMDPSSFDFYPGDSLFWGTFLPYAQGAVAKGMQLTGLLRLGDRDFIMSHLGEADKLYMSGRLMTAFFAAATALVIFFTALGTGGTRAAVFSAAAFSVFYVSAWMGSILKPDGIMLFWGALALRCAFRISAGGGARDYLLAGVFVGLSAVSKYTGVVFALPVVLAWIFSAGGLRSALSSFPRLLSAGGSAAVVFLAVNPYLILRFTDSLGYMKAVASKGAWPSDPLAGYAEYLGYTLPVSLGWPMFLFCSAGLFLMALRRSREDLILVLFAAVYFLKFAAPTEQLLNYCMPLLPVMALAAGALADRIFDRGWGKALVISVAAYTFSYAAYLQSFFLRPSVITMAGEWVAENIPAGSPVAMPKNDSWTPPELRRYDAPYRLLTGGTSQGSLTEAIEALPAVAGPAEYLILSEAEYDQAAKNMARGEPGAARALAKLEEDFEEVKVFSRPLSRFFLPLYRVQESRQVRLTQVTTRIFRNKRAPAR
ncbi:MAG TPA: hypothetical protein DDW67_06790 [Elusimicrobia bacterium]|nr:hypothetical protein [Elusimicrobiota bacterium]